MNLIADRANNMAESVTLKMARIASELKAQGKDVISLSLGEPDFYTPDFVKQAAKNAIDENYTFYSPVPGFPELKKAVCEKFKRDNDLVYSPEQIVVSTGAKHSLMNICLATINPGDEVILPAPYWVSYIEMVKFAEGIPVIIDTDIRSEFKITPSQLEKAITEKTKLFMFSNPCNPSGSVYSGEELESLAKVFAKHPNVLIVSDEIYEYINFVEKTVSIGTFENIKDRVITVNGLAKGHAMTGWRIGYIGAPLDVAKACGKIQGQFTSGANTIAQRAAITALLESPEKVSYMRETFIKRRDLMISLLKDVPGLKLNSPEGAFYLFPDISEFFGKSYNGITIKSAEDLCAFLLEDCLVATTPGCGFGNPDNIRLSYANSDDQLIEAAKRIKESLAKLK